MSRVDKWIGLNGFRFALVFGGLIVGLTTVIITLMVIFVPDTQADHRDQCRQMNGRFAAGGKGGDDICFMPDGRVFKVW